MSDRDDKGVDTRRQPISVHLRELRNRLFFAALGVLVGMVAAWFLFDPVFAALQQPLQDVASQEGVDVSLNFNGLASSLDVRFMVSAFLGVIISSPWWIYQIWAFATPGLTSKERRYAGIFTAGAVPLFLLGAAVAWWALPAAVRVLTGFVPDGAVNLIDAQTYLGFVTRLILAFGAAFMMPMFMIVLSLIGVVKAGTWLKGWRWAIVLAFTFSAIMTPTPDAMTMILVALPICALYFGAVGVCALIDKRRAKQRAAQDAADAAGATDSEVSLPVE